MLCWIYCWWLALVVSCYVVSLDVCVVAGIVDWICLFVGGFGISCFGLLLVF